MVHSTSPLAYRGEMEVYKYYQQLAISGTHAY
jgi:hypothetical protein